MLVCWPISLGWWCAGRPVWDGGDLADRRSSSCRSARNPAHWSGPAARRPSPAAYAPHPAHSRARRGFTMAARSRRRIPPAPALVPRAATYPAPATTGPRLAFPEKFNADPGGCQGFLMQCSLFVAQQPTLYLTENSRIAFVCSLFTGKAFDWATAVWGENAFRTFENFLAQFRTVFDHSATGESTEERLLAVSAGRKAPCDCSTARA
ncbi:hypothetical protein Q7C36_003438 [Tachysurus vachellii]|uniref:DUF4939 domain-containing protein n=1 Tax=Tachysurus vachellii TaxID=175792 RepID=A0AA88T7E6_TACVA|nr:hypothetical protein Q7C36_003438 [Tachysurus vachellii]